jgi:DtxR family Mn-dependent transcriptional regulator
VPVEARPLTALEPGEQATVEQVPDGEGDVLRYLSTLALVPGQNVVLVQAAPFGGPLTIRTGGGEAAISRELGAKIRVSR